MIDEGTPPDLIVDLTSRGSSTDVIQSLTASLGIPTITASSAAEGDLKYTPHTSIPVLSYSYQRMVKPEQQPGEVPFAGEVTWGHPARGHQEPGAEHKDF
jgi:hypothetical protein